MVIYLSTKKVQIVGVTKYIPYLEALYISVKILTVSLAANSGFSAVSEMPDTTLD